MSVTTWSPGPGQAPRGFVRRSGPLGAEERRARDDWLQHQRLPGAGRDAASREAEVLHAGLSRARDAELVAHPDREDRYRVLLGGYLPHGVGQPADYAVLLGGPPDPRLAE